jgi:hypothetical protein
MRHRSSAQCTSAVHQTQTACRSTSIPDITVHIAAGALSQGCCSCDSTSLPEQICDVSEQNGSKAQHGCAILWDRLWQCCRCPQLMRLPCSGPEYTMPQITTSLQQGTYMRVLGYHYVQGKHCSTAYVHNHSVPASTSRGKSRFGRSGRCIQRLLVSVSLI